MNAIFNIKVFSNPTNKRFFSTNCVDSLRINLMSNIIF